jgi:hypothetical protein
MFFKKSYYNSAVRIGWCHPIECFHVHCCFRKHNLCLILTTSFTVACRVRVACAPGCTTLSELAASHSYVVSLLQYTSIMCTGGIDHIHMLWYTCCITRRTMNWCCITCTLVALGNCCIITLNIYWMQYRSLAASCRCIVVYVMHNMQHTKCTKLACDSSSAHHVHVTVSSTLRIGVLHGVQGTVSAPFTTVPAEHCHATYHLRVVLFCLQAA